MAEYTNKTEFETVIAEQWHEQTGRMPTEQELIDCADNLLLFFKILIEADKKLMKAYKSIPGIAHCVPRIPSAADGGGDFDVLASTDAVVGVRASTP
ncbi:MAG: hypothetical protein P9X22_00035 [Candidatus Zapsychrus exili]|nr:hypothetical protein [Candidatus Zapsychrus exili]